MLGLDLSRVLLPNLRSALSAHLADDCASPTHPLPQPPPKRPSPGILRISALEPGLATEVRAIAAERGCHSREGGNYAARPMTTSLGLPSVVLPRAMTRNQ